MATHAQDMGSIPGSASHVPVTWQLEGGVPLLRQLSAPYAEAAQAPPAALVLPPRLPTLQLDSPSSALSTPSSAWSSPAPVPTPLARPERTGHQWCPALAEAPVEDAALATTDVPPPGPGVTLLLPPTTAPLPATWGKGHLGGEQARPSPRRGAMTAPGRR